MSAGKTPTMGGVEKKLTNSPLVADQPKAQRPAPTGWEKGPNKFLDDTANPTSPKVKRNGIGSGRDGGQQRVSGRHRQRWVVCELDARATSKPAATGRAWRRLERHRHKSRSKGWFVSRRLQRRWIGATIAARGGPDGSSSENAIRRKLDGASVQAAGLVLTNPLLLAAGRTYPDARPRAHHERETTMPEHAARFHSRNAALESLARWRARQAEERSQKQRTALADAAVRAFEHGRTAEGVMMVDRYLRSK